MVSKIKLVIWDLDNTLWDGTVFYKDKDSVTLKPGTAAALKELNKRDIKNSICSKNYDKDAKSKLEEFKIDKYFEHPQIGWNRKSESIKKLAEIFKVEFSEILFVDDDPFQRAEVSSQIPDLNIIELTDPIDILNYEGIMVENPTEIDKQRVQILKQQRDREVAEKGAGSDFKAFLKTCNMKMNVRFGHDDDLPRVVQLLNRTNELNATNNRYMLDELKKEFVALKIQIFVVELKDKFGDYGLIAEAITFPNDKDLFIRDLTVSCRTMGRGIGGALVTTLVKYAKQKGFKTITGYVDESESNWRMKPLYQKRGFVEVKSQDGKIYYSFLLDQTDIPPFAEFLDVDIEAIK